MRWGRFNCSVNDSTGVTALCRRPPGAAAPGAGHSGCLTLCLTSGEKNTGGLIGGVLGDESTGECLGKQ